MKRALTRWAPQEATAAIRQSKRVYKGDLFDIRILPTIKDYARLLVVTPRKSGNAAERNLFRRRVKALFFENKLYERGFDWIFFAKKGVSKVSFSDLHNLLGELAHSLSAEQS